MRQKAETRSQRLLIVSNRAPFSFRRRGRKTELVRSIGGAAGLLGGAIIGDHYDAGSQRRDRYDERYDR